MTLAHLRGRTARAGRIWSERRG